MPSISQNKNLSANYETIMRLMGIWKCQSEEFVWAKQESRKESDPEIINMFFYVHLWLQSWLNLLCFLRKIVKWHY